MNWPEVERERMPGYQWTMNCRRECEVNDIESVIMPLELPEGGELLVKVASYGRNGEAAQYHLLCEHRGIKFSIGFGEWGKCRPNCAADASSLAAMTLGIPEFRRLVCQVVGALGGEIVRGTWKRVDLAVDFMGVGVAEFVKPYLNGDYVARAVQGEVWFDDDETAAVHFERRKITGLTHGAGVKLRIYDKLLEACKGDPEKLAFLEENRFKGAEKVTRVEFQFRSEHLRKFELEDWDQFEEMRAKVTAWAVNSWFRLAVVTDRTRTSYTPVLPIWEMVQRAFSEIYSVPPELPKCRKGASATVGQLCKQAFGVVAAVAALMTGDGAPASWAEAVKMVLSHASMPFDDKVIAKKLERGHDVRPVRYEVPDLGELDLT